MMRRLVDLGCDLTILFTILKGLDLIYWSWFWVLSPLWGPVALILIIIVMDCFFALVDDVRKKLRNAWRGSNDE